MGIWACKFKQQFSAGFETEHELTVRFIIIQRVSIKYLSTHFELCLELKYSLKLILSIHIYLRNEDLLFKIYIVERQCIIQKQ